MRYGNKERSPVKEAVCTHTRGSSVVNGQKRPGLDTNNSHIQPVQKVKEEAMMPASHHRASLSPEYPTWSEARRDNCSMQAVSY